MAARASMLGVAPARPITAATQKAPAMIAARNSGADGSVISRYATRNTITQPAAMRGESRTRRIRP